MLDSITFDQLRLFIAVAEEGSFSSAGKKLYKVQSAVSYGVANLEDALGLTLFDRSQKKPQLTPAGKVLLQDAKHLLKQLALFYERASTINDGFEPELSVVFDVMFPMDKIVQICASFSQKFPNVSLKVHTDALSAIEERVVGGHSQIGIANATILSEQDLVIENLTTTKMLPVVASSHPLADEKASLSRERLQQFNQIVLTDRGEGTKGIDRGVFSPKTWRVADLETKKAFLLHGLGWGNMPMYRVCEELKSGKLVRLRLQEEPFVAYHLHTFYREVSPPRKAGRWFIEELRRICKEE